MAAKKKKPTKPVKTDVKASASVDVQLSTVANTNPVADGPRAPPNHYRLRLEAQAAYLADLNGGSVEDLHKLEKFAEVNIGTMRRWQHEDDWSGKRKVMYQNLQKRLATEIGSKLTDRIFLEVQNLLEMKTQAKMLRLKTDAKSWEGIAKAEMDIDKRLAEIQRMLAEGVIDDVGRPIDPKDQEKKSVKIEYDAETLREISRMFTTKKREELRARLEAKNGKDVKKEHPNAEVPKGPEPGTTEDLPIPEIQTSVGSDHGGGGHEGDAA